MFWCIILILVVLIVALKKLDSLPSKAKMNGYTAIVFFLIGCCIWGGLKLDNNKNSSPEKTETVASIKSEAKSDVEVKELSAETIVMDSNVPDETIKKANGESCCNTIYGYFAKAMRFLLECAVFLLLAWVCIKLLFEFLIRV